MNIRTWWVILFLAPCLTAGAQTMYKCGNTYSQNPCDSAAREYKLPGAKAPPATASAIASGKPLSPADESKVEALKARCADALRTVPMWKDRDTIKMGSINRGTETRSVVLSNGSFRQVVPYYTMINAKNSYGAYGGEKVAACYFDLDEKSLVDVYTAN
ncbi:hypothetical protein [Xylophilus ampelinus]|nr:hypothetical protein [Xylophilus ampelinus]MCS4509148.1 hypothetical protein [Xylophilus ampelinus]